MTEGEWRGWAPGRVNLIGEHVDYLGGPVLPAAVDRLTRVSGVPAAAWSVRSDTPGGEPYLRAMAEELGVGPQAAEVASEVPPAAGISSSAALLVAIAAGLRPDLDGSQAALACQRAEQRATGVQVGIMDQFASAMGQRGRALLLDCATLEYRAVPFPEDLLIAVIDSGVRRRLQDTPYNQRRHEAESGMPSRRRHVDSEIVRVHEFAAALEAGDRPRLGELLKASHRSLRDDFEVSTPAVDALVERAWAVPGCVGARIMGAGFGGSILALVEPEAELELRRRMAPRQVLVCRTADGPYAGAGARA
ncbi:MAG TPA: galactokinase family protein [Candidatus Dormibacteraeota bacterium]|jgi:galactokinase|nr:galactokinase family protein [Candidatus Dormibacteraeota bacterium]